MSFIDDNRIEGLLRQGAEPLAVAAILEKSKRLERLAAAEVAILLNTKDHELRRAIKQAAQEVKDLIYGKRIVIFAPLYVSNLCQNECLYCAFRADNKNIMRRALSQTEIKQETEFLLQTGQKRVLLVSGEAYPQEGLDYILRSIETIYSARHGQSSIRRINVNIAPLTEVEFKQLQATGIGTYQLFQETYHRPSYSRLHLKGPKADYDNRLLAIDRAFRAGINDVGIGLLFGLYDYRYEVMALISHIEYLEKTYGMGPHTISVPRLEPASGSTVAAQPPYPVNDDDFEMIIAILRLAVPYTGLILSTRETPKIRRASLDLGISQISAGSRTNPGGYSQSTSAEQFSLGDHRPLDEVIYDICKHGYLPSFCTSCYRLGRTGLDFMEYAKPGDIKKKCLPNALITFQEYLEDYASPKTRAFGMELISLECKQLPVNLRNEINAKLERVKLGERDIFL